MDWNYIGLIAIIGTLLFVLIQRTEPRRRRLSIAFGLLCLLVIRHNTFLKADFHEETLIGFILGIVLGGIFWLLVGRYNPVAAEDNIRVMGMDD